jgi:hypothetical protein
MEDEKFDGKSTQSKQKHIIKNKKKAKTRPTTTQMEKQKDKSVLLKKKAQPCKTLLNDLLKKEKLVVMSTTLKHKHG